MNEHIAKTVKEIRNSRGLTQEALAELIEVSPGHVGILEQGRTKPSYDTIEKLMEKFDLEANIFFESAKGKPQLAAAEIYQLLEGMSESQTHSLVQLFRVGIEIIKANET